MPKLSLGKGHHKRGHVTVLKEPLSLGGSMQAGKMSAIMIDDGPPNEPGILFLSLDVNPVPFKGDTLMTFPIWLMLSIATDQTGGLDLPFVWPQGIPAGFRLYAQVATTTSLPGSPWVSNALELIAQ